LRLALWLDHGRLSELRLLWLRLLLLLLLLLRGLQGRGAEGTSTSKKSRPSCGLLRLLLRRSGTKHTRGGLLCGSRAKHAGLLLLSG
jgi:hypothetical protein